MDEVSEGSVMEIATQSGLSGLCTSTPPLRRVARFAQLKPGVEADYDRLHAAVWPEVLDAIGRAGIRNYSIFRHGRFLFSYFEVPAPSDLAGVVSALLANPVCARWEALVKPLQEPAHGGDGNTHWVPMELVFHAGGEGEGTES